VRPLVRSLRLLAWQPAAVLAAGLALAMVAEASAIGLIGLAGWFIVSCYLCGITVGSAFSYLAPSGAVRSFALVRIAGRYAERLVMHSATLRWLTRLRVWVFFGVAAVGQDRLRGLGTGQALDRVMSDADTVNGFLTRALTPGCVAVAGVLVAGKVIDLESGPAALAFLIGAAVTATIAATAGSRRVRRAGTLAAARGAARTELTAAVDAREEMVSLGAVSQLREASAAALAAVVRAQAAVTGSRSRAQAVVDSCVAITTAAILAICTRSAPRISGPDVALVVLVAAGVLELVAGLLAAVRSGRDGAEAAARLDAAVTVTAAVRAGPHPARPPLASPRPSRPPLAAGTAARVSDQQPGPGVVVVGLPLAPPPARPSGGGSSVSLRLGAGGILIVSGRSGTGKTTLLRALAGELAVDERAVLVDGRPPAAYAPGQIVLVAHDDYVFTGSVAENMRLADPALTAEQVDGLLAAMGLTSRGISAGTAVGPAGSPGRQLSGGERRRLCLARAIASRPRLLLLDEPTEGMDEAMAATVLRQLRELLPQATIVAAIHDKDLGAAAALGDAEHLMLDDHLLHTRP
jgi:ATP-binding cassette, subfamily C, bacterial CydC